MKQNLIQLLFPKGNVVKTCFDLFLAALFVSFFLFVFWLDNQDTTKIETKIESLLKWTEK